jgi:TIR domain
VRVFLSYRRGDVGGYAGRLGDALRQRLGSKGVFQDVVAIAPGQDYTAAIDRALDESDAVLAVIGPGWLASSALGRGSRLFEADDYVRLELARALSRDVRVVPILVGGAALPAAADLPGDLQGLAQRQAVVLHDETWHQDVDGLVRSLRGDPAVPANRRRPWLLAGAVAVVVIALGAGAFWFWGPGSGDGTGQVSGLTIEIRPDHGRTTTAFVISGTGCPHPGDKIVVIFDAKTLGGWPTCQPNHTYKTSYSPDQSGALAWYDANGDQHNLTLSSGTTYTLYVQTTDGHLVSPSVTYRVE